MSGDTVKHYVQATSQGKLARSDVIMSDENPYEIVPKGTHPFHSLTPIF